MNILFLQRDGIDLHHVLFSSETSRFALRFYKPKKLPCGVLVSVSMIGSALSLVRELRWYIRRYVREVLFEIEEGIFCTYQLAQDVYDERAVVLGANWQFRRLYGFRNGKLTSALVMTPDSVPEDYERELRSAEKVIEIWCREDEVEDISLEDQEPEPSPEGLPAQDPENQE